MKRLAWLTDIHLNFLGRDDLAEFLDDVSQRKADAVAITGDIGEAPDVVGFLEELAAAASCPIYFVLGNHDFYGGSIPAVRKRVAEAAAESRQMVYLSAAGVIPLTATTALIGHDGWCDARLGDYEHSDILLNDFVHIEELKKWDWSPHQLDRRALRAELQRWGDEAAAHFARVLPEALKTHRRVVALTHVPPFREATWHQGRYSDDDWLPFFSCKATGEVMRQVMAAHPDRELLVLCGHTHGSGESRIAPNLRVRTGGAQYGYPKVLDVLTID